MARRKQLMHKPKPPRMRMYAASVLLENVSHKRKEAIDRKVSNLLIGETQGEFARIVIDGGYIGVSDMYGKNISVTEACKLAPETLEYVRNFPAVLHSSTCYGLSTTIVAATKQLFFLAPMPLDVYDVLPQSLHKYLPEDMFWEENPQLRPDYEKLLEKYPNLGNELFSVELSSFILG